MVEGVSDSVGCMGIGSKIFGYSCGFERVGRVWTGFFAA
jgi:hypothetical protein